jgi:hypothetical protein
VSDWDLPNLKELEMESLSRKITNKHARQIAKSLPNLESLAIVMKKKSDGIISLCSQLNNLTALNLTDRGITDNDLQEMMPGLGNLEILIIISNPR